MKESLEKGIEEAIEEASSAGFEDGYIQISRNKLNELFTSHHQATLEGIKEAVGKLLAEETVMQKGLPTNDFCYSEYDIEKASRKGISKALSIINSLKK